jgi:hypothetical protein
LVERVEGWKFLPATLCNGTFSEERVIPMATVELEYTVHGASHASAPFRTEHKGMTLSAMTDSLEVELIGVDSRHGSMTLRFIGEEMAAASELFKTGASITATFAAKEGEAEEEE